MRYAMIWHDNGYGHGIIWHDDEYDDENDEESDEEYDEEYVDGDHGDDEEHAEYKYHDGYWLLAMSIKLSKPVKSLVQLRIQAFPSGSLAQADEDKEAKKARKSPFCGPFLSQFSARQQGVVLILSRSIGYSMLLDGLGYNIHWAGADLSSIALTLIL